MVYQRMEILMAAMYRQMLAADAERAPPHGALDVLRRLPARFREVNPLPAPLHGAPQMPEETLLRAVHRRVTGADIEAPGMEWSAAVGHRMFRPEGERARLWRARPARRGSTVDEPPPPHHGQIDIVRNARSGLSRLPGAGPNALPPPLSELSSLRVSLPGPPRMSGP